MGCNGTCARALTHTHGFRISGTVGPIVVVFWFVVRGPTAIGLFTKYGDVGCFFFSRAHVHIPVLYLGNHQCDYVQISYRYGYIVGSWVGVVVVVGCSGRGSSSGRGSGGRVSCSGMGRCSLVVEYW